MTTVSLVSSIALAMLLLTAAIFRATLFAIGTSPDNPQVVDGITFVEALIEEAGLRPARTGNMGIVGSAGVAVPGGSVLAVVLTALAMIGIRHRVQDRA